MPRSRPLILAAVMTASAALVLSGVPAAAKPAPEPLSDAEQRSLAAGIQLAPKAAAGAKDKRIGVSSPNPYLANVRDARRVDYAGWTSTLVERARERTRSGAVQAAKRTATGRAVASPLVHDEEEPAGTAGSNDSQPNAEPVPGFGTQRPENNRVRVLGELADLAPNPSTRAPGAEDNGQLSTATATAISGVGAVTTTGVLGDGPHGSPPGGDNTNDFDFYRLTSRAGLTLTVDTSGASTNVDTVVAVYSDTGALLAQDDDGGNTGLSSLLTFTFPADGSYYVLVAGYGPFGRTLPRDPNDSGSGLGGGAKGNYQLAISAAPIDVDFYAFDLAAGDVLGGTITGGASSLTVYRVDGEQMVGATQDNGASALYPPESPLPGGGNSTFAYVAEEPGSYAVRIAGEAGRYDGLVEAYRPGSQTDRAVREQTVFLDFDGARVNTGIWGGPGVRTLSPFSAFIAKWGLNRADEATLVDRVTATVEENIRTDLEELGLNDRLRVSVINSRRSADVFGQANVSRVIVGGTIAQSGLDTIGIAQFIDPGNFEHEDSAVVLLDVLTDPTGSASLNTYLRPESDRVGFVSRAVGNVISHEIGHLIGNYHTDNVNTQLSIMDAGGTNFGNLFGVGPDGVGGTADDVDTDFSTDRYIPSEGFTGLENTLNVSAWAFVRGARVQP